MIDWKDVSWMPLASSDEARLEEHLRATEALAADRDDVAIRQLISLLFVGRLSGGFHLSVVIESDVGELLLHIANDFTLCSRSERVASLGQDFHHVFCEVAAGQIQTQDSPC